MHPKTGLCFLLLGACLAAPLAAHAEPLPDTVDKVRPSIVGVGTQSPTRQPPVSFLGTGFAVASGNLIVTNAHVVPAVLDPEGKEKLGILVRQNGQAVFRQAELVGTDKEHDLALLRVPGAPLPTLTIGDSSRVREGEEIAFTGFPIGMVLGLYPATHTGRVAGITPIVLPALTSRQLDTKVVKRLQSGAFSIFQLDATAYPGNSGSPVYEPETGKVIGIINMVFVKGTKEAALTAPSGITYAIPSHFIDELLRAKAQ